MSGVRLEPLTLEVALAHYAAMLPEGKTVPLADVARDFGCTKRDLVAALEAVMEVEDRDLTLISNIAIEDDRLVKYAKGGYEGDFRRPVRLSTLQARAALLALDLVSGAADPGILASLRGKIRIAAPGEVVEVEAGARFDEEITAAIERARTGKLVLEIRYTSGDVTSSRQVEPLLMSSIEGRWYLNAYCRRAKGQRLFRLDRIHSARVLGEHFEERGDADLKTTFEDIDPRGYAMSRALVRFSPAVARWMEERPELDLVEEHPDGAADYAMYYSDPAWAARRIMVYLGSATVLEPEELRSEVHRQALTLLEAHGEGA
ncbi:MAG: WYL domain-containing protein [Rubrobacter sp.]|nr:WYL domain-containing protein [Rubrobacter sp.]